MRSFIASAAYVTFVTCTGCVQTPIWLESGNVNMDDYRESKVIILPLEISPYYKLEPGEIDAVQEHIRKNFEQIFDLENLVTIDTIPRRAGYPYQHSEIQALAIEFHASAAVATSVFQFNRAEFGQSELLGLRITFADSLKDQNYWTMSREYTSEDRYQIGSSRLDDTLRIDLRDVETNLASKHGFRGFAIRVSRFGIPLPTRSGPSLGISRQVESTVQNESEIGGALSTTQSQITLQLSAEDESGVAGFAVSNKAAGFNYMIKIDPHNNMLPTFTYDIIDVELVEGTNAIVITATNGDGNETVRDDLKITRTISDETYLLGIGFSQYNQKTGDPEIDEYRRNIAHIERKFDAGNENFNFLKDDAATSLRIENGIYELYDKARSNDAGLGVFYFSGVIKGTYWGYFLVAADSDSESVDVTGVDLAFVSRAFENFGTVILDLCVDDPSSQSDIRELLPENSLVSFDSCSSDQQVNANRIFQMIDDGRSFREAISLTSAEADLNISR